ncbi:MAG TPA: VWA domain-containing protein [Candidatus Tectomicrobia bacterium]|nr:VWA domain-containing protein [Candidatus Tectomicrobia bacterium]
MLTPPLFPFTAIVGQEPMKRALVLNAIYPAIGGVLIAGEKGTAKSTAVRALATLLPEIAVVADCAYSCDPDRPEASCITCQERRARGESLPVTTRRVRMVELPVGATEDRMLGTIDVQAALQDGTYRFEPGLLAVAHRGILYVDEVNLLPDHLVDALLDVAASGVNVVEREGISYAHPAHFILVGTMNPEEGELRPQLLDRFGITAEVLTCRDPELRYEVVRRRLAFERDSGSFRREWEAREQKEAKRIQRAAACLPTVQLDERLARSIADICAAAGVDGLRGDLVIHKAAMALAAYAGRNQVSEDDVQEAVVLALAHRRRRRPFEPPVDSPPRVPPPQGDRTPPPPPPETGRPLPPSQGKSPASTPTMRDPRTAPPPHSSPSRGEGQGGAEPRMGEAPEWQFAPQGDGALPQLALKSRPRSSQTGRRGVGTYEGTRGPRAGVRPVGPRLDGSLALDATIRAAARFQPSRRRQVCDTIPSPPTCVLPREGGGYEAHLKASGRLLIHRQDWRVKLRRTPTQHLYILVVDSSGSMAAYRRMAQVKGVLLGLLREVYRHRDGVAVIAFRGAQSELLLAPTRSPEAAQTFLEALPTGGRTPLAHALLRVETLLTHERRRRSAWIPILVLVTDGRPNRGLTRTDPLQESLAICRRLASSDLPAVVVDTEAGNVRLGLAGQFATALSAAYVRLDRLLRETP